MNPLLISGSTACWLLAQGESAAWVGTQAPPPELAALNRKISNALKAIDITFDDRPYHPHVTLARKAMPPPGDKLERGIVWRIDEFSLVASVPGPSGSTYRRLTQWPLRPRSA